MLLATGLALVVPILVSVVVVHRHRAETSAGDAAGAVQDASNAHLLLAIAAIIGAAVLGGRAAVALRQPPVVGEIVAGILLGPTLLGRVDPAAMRWLFPSSVRPMLHGLAVIGLVLFMFGVGREFSAMRLRGSGARTSLVTAASLLLPFAVGTLVAVGPAGDYVGPLDNRLAFAIFLGCALSVTAFPVLARILADLRLTGTRVGQLSLFAAALGDGVAWLFLALALATAQGPESGAFGRTVVGALLATLLLLGPARWAARAAVARAAVARAAVPCDTAVDGRGRSAVTGSRPPAAGDPDPVTAGDPGPPLDGPPPGGTPVAGGVDPETARWGVPLVIGVAAAAALTAAVGVHEIIGAFLAGLICPRGYRPLDAAAQRLAGVTRVVLLPVFFAGFGLSLDLGALPMEPRTFGVGAVLLAAAVVTKLAGPGLCGRLTGLGWREAAGLGALLNARGLTELVVLQIGAQAGIIDHRLLAILVVVTLVTTAMSGPLVRLVGYGPGRSGVAPAGPPKDPPVVGSIVSRPDARVPLETR